MRHLAAVLLLVACAEKPKPPAEEPPPVAAPRAPLAEVGFDALKRPQFNQGAQENFFPLFWRSDANGDGAIQPEELVELWGPQPRKVWVKDGAFTLAFREVLGVLARGPDDAAFDPDERERRRLVRLELQQGMPTLVETDLSAAAPWERELVKHLQEAALHIETLYARQRGAFELQSKLDAQDVASAALFHRNQGPWCVAPRTSSEPRCSALPGLAPPRRSGLYPAELQEDPRFCEKLAADPEGPELAAQHFAVVRQDRDGFFSVPYTSEGVYRDDMEQVARALEAASAAVADKGEAALKAYLTAAAAAFRTNQWTPADRAWVAMGAAGSRWYVRVAPDEVYSDPCGWKAGFALQVGRINRESLQWQKKLDPLKGDMERVLAVMAGPPYVARKVAFKLPDFVDVVLNAGDQRNPHGATIGQSLPNWGPVAESGGRTVAMTNLYTDADSKAQLEGQMRSLFCPGTMKRAVTEATPATLSTVLHEAAHNLGPAHDYAVAGKTARESFGGPLASMMEELKAQSSASFFLDWLVLRKAITPELAEQAHLRNVAWAFGHVSRGMYDGARRPQPYSQLAAITLGWLWRAGALQWKPQELSAGGDAGCFEVDLGPAHRAAVGTLAKTVARAKSRGDKGAAQSLQVEFVDDSGEWKRLRGVITERWLRAPKATFVYAIH